jgi:DNA polymerase
MAQRGQPLESDLAPVVVATIHPSAILRGSDSDARDAQRELFTEDLRVAAEAARSLKR